MIHIMHVVAVVVVLHERRYVCLVVTQMVRSVMTVVLGVVIPVVRRTPVGVRGTTKAVKQRRTLVIHRLDDVVRTVDVRRTDHLYVRRRVTHLYHQCSHILVDVRCQHRLDEQHVRASLQGLQHAQVVDVPVAVQVEVRDDVRARVQDHLKLLHRACLREGGSYRLQVEIQTDIRCQRSDIYSSCTRSVRARVRDGCANRRRINHLRLGLSHHNRGSRLSDHYRFGGRCHRYNTRYTAAGKQQRQS